MNDLQLYDPLRSPGKQREASQCLANVIYASMDALFEQLKAIFSMKPNRTSEKPSPTRDETIINPLNTTNIDYPFAALPNVVLHDRTLSAYAKLIYCVGFAYVGPGRWSIWPSHKTLADLCSISEKSVERYVKELVSRGLWGKQERWAGNERQTNLYSYIHPSEVYGRSTFDQADADVPGDSRSPRAVGPSQSPGTQSRRNKTDSYQEQGNKSGTSVNYGSACSFFVEGTPGTHSVCQEDVPSSSLEPTSQMTRKRGRRRRGTNSSVAPETPDLVYVLDQWEQCYSERRIRDGLPSSPSSDPDYDRKRATWRKMLRGLLEQGEHPVAIRDRLYRALTLRRYPYDLPGAFKKQYAKISDPDYPLQNWGSGDRRREIEERRQESLARELPILNERARQRTAQALATGEFLP